MDRVWGKLNNTFRPHGKNHDFDFYLPEIRDMLFKMKKILKSVHIIQKPVGKLPFLSKML